MSIDMSSNKRKSAKFEKNMTVADVFINLLAIENIA